MFYLYVTYLEDTFKNEQSKESAAEIGELIHKKGAVCSIYHTHHKIRQVYKENGYEKKRVISVFLFLTRNEQNPEQNRGYQRRYQIYDQ